MTARFPLRTSALASVPAAPFSAAAAGSYASTAIAKITMSAFVDGHDQLLSRRGRS